MMALLRNPKAAETIRRRYAGTRVPAYRILTIWVRHFFTKQSHQVVEKIECPPIIGRNNPKFGHFLVEVVCGAPGWARIRRRQR
jgi:hypothetical protein